MIQVHPASENLSREGADAFVATGTALLIAGLVGAGASTAAGVYGAKQQQGAANTAAQLQSSAEDKQRAYLEQKDAADRADAERIDRLNRAQADAASAQQHGEFLTTQNLNIDQYNQGQIEQAPFKAQNAAKNRGLAYWLNLDQEHGASYINDAPLLAAHVGGGGSGGGGVAVTPDLTQKVLDNYKALGLTPSGDGSGPTDSAYFIKRYAETGGSTPNNDAYWFGPNGRIAKEAAQAGLKFTPVAPPPPRTLTNVV